MPKAPRRRSSSRSAPRRAKPARVERDKHVLYQKAVQSPDVEIAFVDRIFKKLRGRTATRLREDFCGTAYSACEWVRKRRANTAVGLDLDQPTLDWGKAHNLAKLTPDQRSRLTLHRRNVLTPGPGSGGMECILAMNFSYWLFADRPTLLRYFKAVRASLASDGLFFMDCYGGWECGMPQTEKRRVGRFTYLWEQASFNPITSQLVCHIHFRLADGSMMRKAFTYSWRLWTLPEIRELLAEAGFRKSTVHWEGDDGKGGGNGIFRPAEKGDACASWIAYIVAER